MTPSLPVEVLCRILSLYLNTPSLLFNFSDEAYSIFTPDVDTEGLDTLPTFESSRADEMALLNWPVDFRHNIPVYLLHQRRALTGILVCHDFRAILTPLLYQLIVIKTKAQALSLSEALQDSDLARHIKMLIVCPTPVYHPTQALVDSIVASCPNLVAFHDFSRSHPATNGARTTVSGTGIPAAQKLERFSHVSFAISQLERHPLVCSRLVFLEFTTPSCNWTSRLPKIVVELPCLVYLKLEQRIDALVMMNGCSMPSLEYLCFAGPRYQMNIGATSYAFLKKHGGLLKRLEYPDVIWNDGAYDAATASATLDNVCPVLKDLIVDPMLFIDSSSTRDGRLVCGPPRHRQLSAIGLCNITTRVADHPRSSAGGLFRYSLWKLVNTEMFPMLETVRNMAWCPHYSQDSWKPLLDLCSQQGVVFKDWLGGVVV